MKQTAPRWRGDADSFVDELLDWMEGAGNTRYDESLTQFEHALQSAALATQWSGRPELVAAAFLHDVGHLLVNEHEARGDFLSRDHRHERIGSRWLARAFGGPVTAPVDLHVPAKRYLCAADPAYHASLSESSKRSLVVQGGPMSAVEMTAFRGFAGADDALQVRRIDDLAKVAGLAVPPASTYRELLIRLARSEG